MERTTPLPWWRRGLRALGWCVLGAFLAAVAIFVARGLDLPDLEPWHQVELKDFEAGDADDDTTLDDYLAVEAQLFSELTAASAEWEGAREPLSRYNPAGPMRPGIEGRDWNRTFQLPPAGSVVGTALLLHGLSDSPYSVRAAAELLAAHGYHALGMRMPGHGAAPGVLAGADWRDWRSAVEIGARAAAEKAPGKPFFVVGYSNGAALAVDYSLAALDDNALPRPDGLVLMSPALRVSKLAALAGLQIRMSHLPGLGKLAWTDVVPEYDPYKYNSFPLAAAQQIYRLTDDVESRLVAVGEAGRLGELPPVLAFASVVDATVPQRPSLERLYGRRDDPRDQLVLFDLRRGADVRPLLAAGAGSVATMYDAAPLPYAITLVTNRGDEQPEMIARSREAGASEETVTPIGLDWPPSFYSLSHVALPFPADDPLYGVDPAAGRPISLGDLEPRGERGVLIVSADLLQRLRSNVFFDYLEERTLGFVDGIAGVEREVPETAADEEEQVAAE